MAAILSESQSDMRTGTTAAGHGRVVSHIHNWYGSLHICPVSLTDSPAYYEKAIKHGPSLNSSPLVLHTCVSESGQHWGRHWLVACSTPSHYLNQCWVIINWTLRKKLQWNFNQNAKPFIHENAYENIICEKAAILSKGDELRAVAPRTRRSYCPACRTYLIATRFWVVVICPIIECLTVLEFSFILFDLCLFITIFNFIFNYVPIVTFWIFTYHKIWILLIIFCFIWNYWIIYFLTCLDVFWSVVS